MTKHKRPSPRDTGRHDTKANAEDVASLINERRKYEDWIAAVEAKRDVTPAHVFTRVHADYETRLRAIVDKLASHTNSLNDELATLKKRLAQIDAEIRKHEDERAEIEIRGQVGELDEEDLSEALSEADEGLAKLATSRKAVETDVERVTEFFAAASGGPSPSRASFDEL